MQIAGLDWCSCHSDPDLAGTGLRKRADLQVQDLGRFAQRVSDDGPHRLHLLDAPSVDPALTVIGLHPVGPAVGGNDSELRDQLRPN
jgi:hypothetical protein